MISNKVLFYNLLDFIGFTYAFCIQMYGLYIHGLKMVVFLTSWCGILECCTFLHLLISKKSFYTEKLLISSWSLGWTVVLFFWGYVYPLIDPQKLPPPTLYISSHGGIHLFMAIRFLSSDLQIQSSDFKWTFSIVVLYFVGVVIPLKLFGITLYPGFMEKVVPTFLLVAILSTCLWLCFYIGLLLSSKKDKKVREE